MWPLTGVPPSSQMRDLRASSRDDVAFQGQKCVQHRNGDPEVDCCFSLPGLPVKCEFPRSDRKATYMFLLSLQLFHETSFSRKTTGAREVAQQLKILDVLIERLKSSSQHQHSSFQLPATPVSDDLISISGLHPHSPHSCSTQTHIQAKYP